MLGIFFMIWKYILFLHYLVLFLGCGGANEINKIVLPETESKRETDKILYLIYVKEN